MKIISGIIMVLVAVAAMIYVQKQDGNQSDSALENAEAAESMELPGSLKEISGIALSPEGRLFGHNDEKGMVVEIDLEGKRINKTFYLGRPAVREDFEDIAIVGKRIFLVTSSGELFEFPEGDHDEVVEYRRNKTHLDSGSDVEGLCYDPVRNTLLLACKGDAGNGIKNSKAIYEYSLEYNQLSEEPRFLIPEKGLMKKQKNGFAPSAITYNGSTGQFFVISSRAKMLVILETQGTISGVYHLPEKQHFQPEGIAFLPDETLLISDEGGTGRAAMITTYKAGEWKKWKHDK
jgi:uncharacterized protein YjiK